MSIASCPKDGTPITVHGQPGMQLVGNYEFLQFIGAGGMGVIYKAKHPVLNRLVDFVYPQYRTVTGRIEIEF